MVSLPPLRWSRPVSMVNGRVFAGDGVASSVRFLSTVLAVDMAPRAGDEIVDLDGAFVLPGMVNAHDHLELNHYGQLRPRDRYDNATAWIDDLEPALRENPGIREGSAHPLRDRLFVGGLKNLLAGATTVAHHNPIYRELSGRFPVRVLKRFGWAHSFQMERRPVGAHGEPGGGVRERFAATSRSLPFIVHAGEGIDAAAADEVPRLDTLGCLRSNTVLVHAVALGLEGWVRALAVGASLVWCPASNVFLFGRTIPTRSFLDATPDAWKHLCLGSDSRVTGSRDLLDELRAAAEAAPVTASELLRMVTSVPATVLRRPDLGRIAVGDPADLVVVPATGSHAADALLAARRSDVLFVAVDGRPMVADRSFSAVFKARCHVPRRIVVDGVERLADARLAWDIERCPIREPGVAAVT